MKDKLANNFHVVDGANARLFLVTDARSCAVGWPVHEGYSDTTQRHADSLPQFKIPTTELKSRKKN